MKGIDKKLEFVKLRAEGKSYASIGKELSIAKDTCSKWERELKDQIEELQREQLEELYTSYGMTKQARIKSLGEIIARIDEARENAQKPLELIGEDRLLELRLKYVNQLAELYREPIATAPDYTLDGVIEDYDSLYSRATAGELTAQEIRAQLSILDAKRDALYKYASELNKEEDENLELKLGYTSPLIRHDEDEEAE